MRYSFVFCVALSLIPRLSSSGETQNAFSEVAPASGVTFERAPSDVFEDIVIAFRESSLTNPLPPAPPSFLGLPLEPHGLPGVPVFDYDLDGDLDLLATNGPGAAVVLRLIWQFDC